MIYSVQRWIKNGDWYSEEYLTEEVALAAADRDWNVYLTKDEKDRTEFFAVMAGEADEDGCFDVNTADIIKQYK